MTSDPVVRILGPVTLRDDEGSERRIRSSRRRRLLAYLAVHRGDFVPADRLADALDLKPSALRTSISRLRADLGDGILLTQPSGYLLRADATDADRAEALLDRAAAAPPTEARRHLQAALEWWRGASFGSLADDPWVQAESLRLDERRAKAVEDLAELLVADGRAAEAVPLLQSHVRRAPLRDRARRLLMTSLATTGRTTEALRAYQDYRRYLAEEVGVEPPAATAALEQTIAVGQPVPLPSTAGLPVHGTFLVVRPADRSGGSPAGDGTTDPRIAHAVERSVLAFGGRTTRIVVDLDGPHRLGAYFDDAADAVLAARAVQTALTAGSWDGPRVAVGVGVHTGRGETVEPDPATALGGDGPRIADRLAAFAETGTILVSDAVAAPDGEALQALGVHRLDGVDRPISVLLVGETRPGDDTRRGTEATNLPPTTDALIGRDHERRAVIRSLDDHRIVSVCGLGGVGKTRLIRAVAEDRLARHLDGVWFVEVARADDLGSLLSAVSGATGQPVADDPARLAAVLAGHDLLLVLDNCEHVAGPVGELVSTLLEQTSRLRILVSSRTALGVEDEHTFHLDPLGEAGDAVALFRRRAEEVGVELGDEETEAVGAICERLDRLPLAIELAAATCQILAPAEIAERLDRRFQLLRGTGRTAGRARQSTLRAAVDWSYESLDPDARVLLRRLSVFDGGFGIDAVESMADDLATPEIFLLGDLIDRSLISVSRADGGARYEQLETIRTYGRDRLDEEGESTDALARHLRWCEAMVDHHVGRLDDPASEVAAIRALAREAGNLRAAVARAIDRGDTARAADLVARLADVAHASNPLAELVGPIISVDGHVDHPRGRELLGMELVRRSVADGTEGREELARTLRSALTVDDPGHLQIPVVLISAAFGDGGDDAHLAEMVARAVTLTDAVESARLLVAAALGRAYAPAVPIDDDIVDAMVEAVDRAGLARLRIPAAVVECLAALESDDTATIAAAVRRARTALRLVDEFPAPSIMISGLIGSFTEAAIRGEVDPAVQTMAIDRLGPVLTGDFNRIGLAMARLVQHHGAHDLAVRAVAAGRRDGRSHISSDRVDRLLRTAEDQLGVDVVGALLDGRSVAGDDDAPVGLEPSDLYREMRAALAETLRAGI